MKSFFRVVVVEEPGEEPRLYRQDTGELVTDANGFLRGSAGFSSRRSKKEQRSHRFRKETQTVSQEPLIREEPDEEKVNNKRERLKRADVIIEEKEEVEKDTHTDTKEDNNINYTDDANKTKTEASKKATLHRVNIFEK